MNVLILEWFPLLVSTNDASCSSCFVSLVNELVFFDVERDSFSYFSNN